MAVEVGRQPLAGGSRGTSPLRRIYGLGSVYAKSLRDARLSFLILAGILGGVMLLAGAGVGSVYHTEASRRELANLAGGLSGMSPILAGLVGNPIDVGTIGGYVNWKYGPVFIYVAGIWSILALSGTLAAEARRGSLDMIATAPLGRRRLALEKLAAHLTVMTAVMVVTAIAVWLVGAAFGTVAGDELPFAAAAGYGLWLGLVSLAAGSVAFALAPLLGRGAAAGIAVVVMVAAYLLNGYQALAPALGDIAHASWFYWTAKHVPLAGLYDWRSLLPVAAVSVVLLAIGVEVFARRDVGASASVGSPSLPGPALGLGGPVGRALSERLPTALAWGLGLGFFGFLFASASRSLTDALTKMSPDVLKVVHSLLPDAALSSAGGFLQLVFVQLGFIVVGFAAAALVSGWASDERSGRLEMLLTTPLARGRWAVSGTIGVYLAIVGMTVVLAAAVGLGAVVAGSDAGTPMLGSITLGLYSAAMAGVGVAVGGVFRASVAAAIVAAVVTVTFLIDLLAPGLKAPDWVHQLALTSHLGKPMIGRWDASGIIACVAIAVAGLLLAAWGMRRRDVAR